MQVKYFPHKYSCRVLLALYVVQWYDQSDWPNTMGIATINPASGELLKSFEPLTNDQIGAKIRKADETFACYRLTPFSRRREWMSNAAEIIENQKNELGCLMTLEMGKLHREAIAEAAKCALACRYYADNAERLMADETVTTGAKKSFIRYQPIGPVLAVMPWNFPLWQVFRFIAPGLMAGNVGLLKHASNVPQCALKIEEILLHAGFPEGVFQTLLVGAKQVDAILADPRIKAATLTGSEGAGIEVGVSAAKRIKKVVLELGGSDPFIVMPSADLEEAAAIGVKARVQNNGQSCIAAKRFIVAESIADAFIEKFVAKMKSLRIGDPMQESTELGPLATPSGVTDLVRDIEKTVQAGARVLAGGKALKQPGNFFEPTVLSDIPKESPAYREEFFGPVASLFRVNDIDEAIRVANDSRFGLGSSIWTNVPAEQERFIRDIETGMVFINKMVASDPRIPFGGVKQSGHGRELGVHGLREFLNIKTVWIQS